MGRKMRLCKVMLLMLAGFASSSARAGEEASLWMADRTSPEIEAAMKQGILWVIIPTAGTEQNGPHMPLSKHHDVLSVTLPRIAKELGNTLIAPIMDYVPEGDITAREGHMRFAGTISLPEDVFQAVLESAANSVLAHGFTHVLLMGDSGGNQLSQQRVAAKMQAEGKKVYHIGDYYANKPQEAWLVEQGFAEDEIGFHAGLRDTSELMAAQHNKVRIGQLRHFAKGNFQTSGAEGNAAKATPDLGKRLLKIKVSSAIRQVCKDVAGATDLDVCRNPETR